MDILKQLNDVMRYVENNLDDEINPDVISRIACTSYNSFCRFFSYIIGITFAEYVRRRKLTEAAYDLRAGTSRVIDIAVKYGYSGADVFSKAFTKQHGISPTAARAFSSPLKIYPPVSFHIIFKGAEKMDFRIVETNGIEVYGIARNSVEAERYELEHIMWSDKCDDIPSQICDDYDGVWYGIWNNGNYMIAREKSDVTKQNLEKYVIPEGKYAAFTTERGGYAGDELPKLHDLIFNSWMPSSDYVQSDDLEIEVYHLQTNTAKRKKNRYYEIWIPVKSR